MVTDEAAGRTIPNSFLDKVKDDFFAKYSQKGKEVKELGLSNYGYVVPYSSPVLAAACQNNLAGGKPPSRSS